MVSLPTHTLNDGTVLPGIGFGTYPMRGTQATSAVLSALEAGYRLIDTAAMYKNESEVGQAFRDSGLDRAEVLIQTKLPVGPYGAPQTVTRVESALQRLEVDVIDVMLIHWPFPGTRRYIPQWRGLVEARERGLVKTIGVSNFSKAQIDAVVSDSGVTPAVNQIQVNPVHPASTQRDANSAATVLTEAYSPLGQRRAPFDAAPVVAAAKAHDVTPAQVILRWHIEIGTLPLPKSSSPQRQKANFDIAGFSLTADEVSAISALG